LAILILKLMLSFTAAWLLVPFYCGSSIHRNNPLMWNHHFLPW